MFDAVLPRDSVWVAHMQAAVVLVAVAIGYVVYMLRSGLGRRVQLDKVRLRGLFGRGQSRLSAVIALMYWIFFVTMSGLLVSGGAALFRFLLRLRRGDAALGGDLGDPRLCRLACPDPIQERRRFATAAHLSSRRAACAAAAARCHRTAGHAGRAVSALAGSENADAPPEVSSHPLQPGTEARRDRTRQLDAAPARSRNPTLQANAFVVAAAAAITGASLIVATDHLAVDSVQIRRINPADAPILDGDTSDRAGATSSRSRS